MSKRLRIGKGFTLIELLVVIAIIAILAAILFPVMAQVKNKAHVTTCNNNLKQWGTGLQSYMSDYNDRFPFAGICKSIPHKLGVPPLGIGGSRTCYDALYKYTGKSEKIRYCPSAVALYKSIPQTEGWSYYYYCAHSMSDPWILKCALCGYGMSDVRFATRKPAISETGWYHEAGRKGNKLTNILFCDGHVRTVVQRGNLGVGWMSRKGEYPPKAWIDAMWGQDQ